MSARLFLLVVTLLFIGIAFLLAHWMTLPVATVIAFMLIPIVLGNTVDHVTTKHKVKISNRALAILIKKIEGTN